MENVGCIEPDLGSTLDPPTGKIDISEDTGILNIILNEARYKRS